MKCIYCHSDKLISSGYRITKLERKAIKKCLNCNKKFTIGHNFSRYRFDKKIILQAVSLHKKKSLSEVKEYLLEKYKIKVSRYTISRWYKKFKTL